MQHRSEETSGPTGEQTPRAVTSLQRLLQHGAQLETASSVGEAVVPFFLAALEACWFNGVLIGLAGVDFLHTGTALLPFWGPFLLLGAALWLFQRTIVQEASPQENESAHEQESSPHVSADFRLLFGVLALLDVVLIWLQIYSGTNFLLDPRWLLAFVNDLLSLNDHFYQALALVAMAIYFCWRGSRLAQIRIEPGEVWRRTWVGLLILLAAIFLYALHSGTGGNGNDIVLVLLLPAMLYCSLSAHALARISFVRRSHPFGLEGNVVTQERAVLSVIGGVGLLMLVLTLLGGLFFNGAFFEALQPAWRAIATLYDWLVNAITLLLGWILTPLFALLTRLFPPINRKTIPQTPPTGPIKGRLIPPVTSTAPGIILAGKIILPLLILLGLSVLLWLTLRRRKRRRIVRNRASGDIHESIWSWELFWRQFKAFWATLFRLNRRTDEAAQDASGALDLPGESAARTLREIYRALLKKAATLGYVRLRHETPHEFQQRVNRLRASSSEPQLGLLTDAYSSLRYGGQLPDEYELASALRNWEELERKWEQAP